MTFVEDFKKAESEAYAHLDEDGDGEAFVPSGGEFRHGVRTLLDALQHANGDLSVMLGVMRAAREYLEWQGWAKALRSNGPKTCG